MSTEWYTIQTKSITVPWYVDFTTYENSRIRIFHRFENSRFYSLYFYSFLLIFIYANKTQRSALKSLWTFWNNRWDKQTFVGNRYRANQSLWVFWFGKGGPERDRVLISLVTGSRLFDWNSFYPTDIAKIDYHRKQRGCQNAGICAKIRQEIFLSKMHLIFIAK